MSNWKISNWFLGGWFGPSEPPEPSDYTLQGGKGTFLVEGNPSGFLVTRLLVSQEGQYQVVGGESSLRRDLRLVAGAGSFTASGQEASLLCQRYADFSGTEFVVNAPAADILRIRSFEAGTGELALDGGEAGISLTRLLVPQVGLYVIGSNGSDFLRNLRLECSGAVYSSQGNEVQFTLVRNPQPEVIGSSAKISSPEPYVNLYAQVGLITAATEVSSPEILKSQSALVSRVRRTYSEIHAPLAWVERLPTVPPLEEEGEDSEYRIRSAQRLWMNAHPAYSSYEDTLRNKPELFTTAEERRKLEPVE